MTVDGYLSPDSILPWPLHYDESFPNPAYHHTRSPWNQSTFVAATLPPSTSSLPLLVVARYSSLSKW